MTKSWKKSFWGPGIVLEYF